jgi:glycosyltransferase involved in cell wall biosynthesis
MKKCKVLFLLGDIWSMGKNKGMPSIFKLLEKADKEFNVTIFTTDKEDYSKELPNSKIFYFKKVTFTSKKNRYLKYIYNRWNNFILNIKYLYFYFKINEKYDVVYCSSSVPIFATYIIKLFSRVKTIHRIYGTFLYGKTDSFFEKLKKFEEVLSFKLPADKYIITDDGTFGDKVAEYFNVPKEKIIFLKNGVDKINTDIEEIKKKFNLNNADFKCLAVSRLVSWKRVDRIIKAFNNIENNKIKLYIVGDGDELPKLKKLAKNKNIFFLGALSSKEVQGLMECTDCFISMYDVSNVSNPLLEAMAHSMPIITYDSGNTKSIINGKNGILITKQNEEEIVNELREVILHLYNNSEYLKDLSQNAKVFFENNLYTWDRRIDMEINIIREMCEK